MSVDPRTVGPETTPEATQRLLGDTPYLCQCFRIDEPGLIRIVDRAGTHDYDVLREYYDIGSRCTSCEIDVRDFLHELSQGRAESSDHRLPLALRGKHALKRLRGEIRYVARVLLRWPRQFALFVVRNEEIESELVLSNLTFPDDEKNANGRAVRFDTLLYDAQGHLVSRRSGWKLGADQSRAFAFDDIAQGLAEDFVGSLHLRFYGLRETGSLRPYCRLKYDRDRSGFAGATHYHDQFLTRKHYQHVMVTHPLVDDQICWVALSNPIQSAYRSRAYLEADGEVHTATIVIPARGTVFRSIPELFPNAPPTTRDPSFFWLESDDTVMAWFFWQRPASGSWIAQHK